MKPNDKFKYTDVDYQNDPIERIKAEKDWDWIIPDDLD
jgi:hypothetical protein